MSEEEKKEFEEFLQWKAEKAKLAEQTGLDKQVEQPEMSKQTDSSVECEADAPQQKDSAQDTTKTSVDVPKENNSGLFIMVAAVSRRDRPLVSYQCSGNNRRQRISYLEYHKPIYRGNQVNKRE